MTLDDQIADLIQNTPSHLINPDAVAAIAPTLRAIAVQLKHPQYYILQNLEQSWVMTALTNRTQPNTRKNVVYAYPTLQDAAASQATIKDPQVMALPVPVITIPSWPRCWRGTCSWWRGARAWSGGGSNVRVIGAPQSCVPGNRTPTGGGS